MKREEIAYKRQRRVIVALLIFCCLILAVVDGYLRPPYGVKAAAKVVLFFLLPLGCVWWLERMDATAAEGKSDRSSSGMSSFVRVFRPEPKAVTLGLVLGIGTMALILGGYALLSPWLDLSAVPAAMAANGGITADNFLYVGTWIALCNSLMEEIFFRGFAFLQLKRVSSRRFAYVVSAAAFSLYHAAIVDGWVSPALYLLMLAALFVYGLFFAWLDERDGRIWASWLMHMGANVAINLIGMRLLGML